MSRVRQQRPELQLPLLQGHDPLLQLTVAPLDLLALPVGGRTHTRFSGDRRRSPAVAVPDVPRVLRPGCLISGAQAGGGGDGARAARLPLVVLPVAQVVGEAAGLCLLYTS